MKKTVFFVILVNLAFTLNAQAPRQQRTERTSTFDDTPAFIFEINSGFAFGINVPDKVPMELKLMYLYNRFGFTAEVGMLMYQEIGHHIFLGPTFFAVNNPKIRVPISLGFDFFGTGKGSLYYGIGLIPSFHYSVNKWLYFSINLNINYAFNNPYDETVGYRDVVYTNIDNLGNPFLEIRKEEIKEKKNHYGNYIFIKPTIGIGFQF